MSFLAQFYSTVPLEVPQKRSHYFKSECGVAMLLLPRLLLLQMSQLLLHAPPQCASPPHTATWLQRAGPPQTSVRAGCTDSPPAATPSQGAGRPRTAAPALHLPLPGRRVGLPRTATGPRHAGPPRTAAPTRRVGRPRTATPAVQVRLPRHDTPALHVQPLSHDTLALHVRSLGHDAPAVHVRPREPSTYGHPA